MLIIQVAGSRRLSSGMRVKKNQLGTPINPINPLCALRVPLAGTGTGSKGGRGGVPVPIEARYLYPPCPSCVCQVDGGRHVHFSPCRCQVTHGTSDLIACLRCTFAGTRRKGPERKTSTYKYCVGFRHFSPIQQPPSL